MAKKSHLQDVKAILDEVKELQADDNEPDEGQVRDWVGSLAEAYLDLSQRLEDLRLHPTQKSLLAEPAESNDRSITIFSKGP